MSFVPPGTFIVDDEDEDWLLPPPKADAYPPGTKPLSIEELLKDVRLSENAGTLSRKIAKHQRRAVRRQSSVTSLSSVAEEERESGSFAPCLPLTPYSDTIPTCDTNIVHCLNVATPEREALWNVGNRPSIYDSNISSPPPPPPTPISDDEDFQDAADSFSEDVLKVITQRRASESIVEDPSSGAGQSLARPIMSQSLVKVEEEEPTTEFKQTSQNNKRSSRSSSVSPRPVSNLTKATKVNARNDLPNDENERFSLASRNVLGRRSLGAQPMKKLAYSSPANSIRPASKRSQLTSSTFATGDSNARSKSVVTNASQNGNNSLTDKQKTQPHVTIQTSPAQRPSLPVTDLHPSIESVQDIARQQEEALREEVLKQQLQQQQIERKHSWQGDGSEPPSVNTSMGSLSSSKSVDIGAIVKTPRFNGAQSKLPRPTGIPLPTKVAHPIIRNPIASLAKSQPNNDEDEFF